LVTFWCIINADGKNRRFTIFTGTKKEVHMGYPQGDGGGGYDRGPREMHKATCADCQKECEVPFKPSGDRPVYCKECFSKRKSEGR